MQINTNSYTYTYDDGPNQKNREDYSPWLGYLSAIISFTLLLVGIAMDKYIQPAFFKDWVRLAWYLVAYVPVGLPVLKDAIKTINKGEVFTEFSLMCLATVGAFAIDEYPEGVAVMLFYNIGELFQNAAVRRAKGNIKDLLDVRSESVYVLRDWQYKKEKPEDIQVGDKIRVHAGERMQFDGVLLSPQCTLDTAALTGKSEPLTLVAGESVLAGMISMNSLIEIQVSKNFTAGNISRALELAQVATARKALTELFIRKFARIYTPAVMFLATLLVILPYFVLTDYSFHKWLYTALVFLVISCPCALVISIPLGYFGGIEAASRNGILFKGSNYLELITKVNAVAIDKTGTLTKGVFKVQYMETEAAVSKNKLLLLVAALEQHSTHPVGKALIAYADELNIIWGNALVGAVQEIAGQGLKGIVDNHTLLVGNTKLLQKSDIAYPSVLDHNSDTIAVMAMDGKYAGFVTISDENKPDAQQTVADLHQIGIRELIMLSGDKNAVVQNAIVTLGIDRGFGDLLPEGKVEKIEMLKTENSRRIVAFIGDGINDAPVLASADIGIAMGGLGSNAAIESANVVIQTDQPSKVAMAIIIGRATRRIVWQNIGLAFVVKAVVLILGAGGLATMWEAVFADVGVTMLAILNAVRIQQMKF